MEKLVFFTLGYGHHHTGESQQADEVGQDHEPVEHVGHVPHEVHLEAGTEHDEEHHNGGIDLHILCAEEGLHVGLAEEIPADDGGKGEEEQADGDVDIAEGTEYGVKGYLGQFRAGAAGVPHAGDDDDKRRAGEHHEGVDEHAHHGHHALIVGVGHLGKSMGMGRGTHTGFVGEEAAGHAVAHGFAHGDAECAAAGGLRIEGHDENGLEGAGQGGNVGEDDDEAAADVQKRHERHELFHDPGNALCAAEEDGGGNERHNDAHEHGGNSEGGAEGRAYGVGLHHVAHEAEGEDDGHGEEGGKGPAEGSGEGCADIVGRSADGFAALVGALVLLGQHGFGIVGGHAEEGAEPHPENGARAACGDGRGRARNVARAHLRGHGGGQRLEGAHAGMVGAFAVQGNIAEQTAEGEGKFTKLDETQADGIKNARAAKQKEKEPAPEHAVDRIHYLSDEFHGTCPSGGSSFTFSPPRFRVKKRANPHDLLQRKRLGIRLQVAPDGKILSSVLWPERFGFRLAPSAPKRDSPELPPLLVGLAAFRQLQRDHVPSPGRRTKK